LTQSYQRNRNIVRRVDGTLVNVARSRGHLFVCHEACCCGRAEYGLAPVPTHVYEREWLRRRFRNFVHLTIGGCLGPCALANVALLLWDGQAHWFQSIGSEALVVALFDYIQGMLEAGEYFPPAEPLASLEFTASSWQGRPDGQGIDDRRQYRAPSEDELEESQWLDGGPHCWTAGAGDAADRAVADMSGAAAMPRKNGELVFEAPWQGRAFGMAVALNEGQVYDWDEFRSRLIERIGEGDAAGDGSDYYERWLAAFESLLKERGIVSDDEIEERAYQFEFGERDEVF
jgi:nitrile hydratase accessory protein